MKLFFADYCEDKLLPSENARTSSTAEILHSMDCVLHMPSNFLGITDESGVTLQFMVNEDRTIHVDVPAPAMRGSYGRCASLQECLDIVRGLGDRIQPEVIPGLKFESW